MSLSKKIDLKRDFAAGLLSVRGPLLSYDPKFHPPYTLYTAQCTCIKYTYSYKEGAEGESYSERRLEPEGQ